MAVQDQGSVSHRTVPRLWSSLHNRLRRRVVSRNRKKRQELTVLVRPPCPTVTYDTADMLLLLSNWEEEVCRRRRGLVPERLKDSERPFGNLSGSIREMGAGRVSLNPSRSACCCWSGPFLPKREISCPAPCPTSCLMKEIRLIASRELSSRVSVTTCHSANSFLQFQSDEREAGRYLNKNRCLADEFLLAKEW